MKSVLVFLCVISNLSLFVVNLGFASIICTIERKAAELHKCKTSDGIKTEL